MAKDLRENCQVEGCKKKAVYNLQNVWQLYECKKDGDYDKLKEWEGDENSFYCEKHYDEEMGN